MPNAKQRRTHGPSADARAATKRDTSTHLIRKTQERWGAELSIIRTGSPRAVARELARLERLGFISPLDAADDVPLGAELLPDPMVEVALGDEDLAQVEAWEPETGTSCGSFVLGATGEAEADMPFVEDAWEIMVRGRACSLEIPRWVEQRRALSAPGAASLHALGMRFVTLRAIAEWLSVRRSAFLESKDLWDLGPAAFSELENKEAPVVQQRFLRLLHLGQAVREDAFSRFLTCCNLVWPDGQAPAQMLFSVSARLAWVARAVVLFVQHQGGNITPRVLDAYSTVTVRKGRARRAQLERQSANSMDIGTFIESVNLAANTRWQEVLEQYSERMVRDGKE